MKTRTVDSNWDWRFGKGLNDYADDALGVAYTVKMKVLSWYKDCFFAMEDGVDWKNILGSKSTKEMADESIRDIIRSEPEITELVYFDSEKVKVFEKMIDALEFAHSQGVGKKVRFETTKEFKVC